MIGFCVGSAFAQQASHKNTAQVRRNERPSFSPAAVGSVNGRIFDDAEGYVSPTKGIGGTRVILRAADHDGEIVGNYISDPDGAYNFQNISPGDYKIEIDPVSIPARYRESKVTVLPVTVQAFIPSSVDLSIAARRVVSGVVFVDKNGDGRYDPQIDESVAGVDITAAGQITTTDAKGRYSIQDLPAGRTSVLATSPHSMRNTQVILDLPAAPVVNRVVNISVGR